MKVIDETWEALGERVVRADEERTWLFAAIPIDAPESGKARARMAAAAPEMLKMLRSLEWSGSDISGYAECPSCQRTKDPVFNEEHRADCAIAALIRKAGGE